jgi:UDP-2,3-diacylglucosamine hydrolase
MSVTTMQPDPQSVATERTKAAVAAGGSIAIICGGGAFPGAVADAVARAGGRPVMFAIKGWADPRVVEQHRHHWIALGQLGRFLRLAGAERCREAVFIGTLLRPALSQIRLDWRTLRMLPRVARAFRGGDDRLLSGVAGLIEEAGVRIVGLKEVAPEILVPAGALGRRQPSPRDRSDMARGFALLAALGPFDVGQAAVIADNNVLAVEAAEGTDNLLVRVADLREQGRLNLPLGIGVLVKAPKTGQDRRFDLPAVGPWTVANAARAGLAGIAVAAGNTIIADAAETIAAADRAGIFLAGVAEGGPQ